MTASTEQLRSRVKDWLFEARRLRAEAKTLTDRTKEQLLGQSDACRFLAKITLAHLKKPLASEL